MIHYKLIISSLLIFLACSNFPEQIDDRIPPTDFIPYLCYISKDKDISIIDVLGNNKKVIKSKIKTYGWSAHKGKQSPIISKNGEYLAYLDDKDLYIKNLKTDELQLIDKYYKETKDYYALSLNLTAWSDSNDFFIYFRNSVSSDNDLKNRSDIKQGFYIYSIKNKTIFHVPQMGGFLQFIPNTNSILCYTINENQNYDTPNIQNNLSYYYITENKFEKFRDFPPLRTGLNMSGNNTLAFVQFKKSKEIQTWIGYIDLIKNKEYQITNPDENQNCQSIYISNDGRFIIFKKEKNIEGKTSSKKYIIIHDVFKNKNEILEPASYNIYGIIDKWFIYSYDNVTISKNLYTGENKKILDEAIFFF